MSVMSDANVAQYIVYTGVDFFKPLQCSSVWMFMGGFNPFPDMRWFGNAIPLLSMGKKTVKQPVYVSLSNGWRRSNIFPSNEFKLVEVISKIWMAAWLVVTTFCHFVRLFTMRPSWFCVGSCLVWFDNRNVTWLKVLDFFSHANIFVVLFWVSIM